MPFAHRFWNRVAKRYDHTSERLDAYRAARLEHMKSFLGSDDNVLDFACATGRLAIDMAPHVGRVLGIDLSEGMIARADAKLRGDAVANVRFECMDLFDPTLGDAQFDVVTAFNVIHLLDEPARYLNRIRALLAPEGLLLTETPCLDGKRLGLRTLIRLVGFTGLLPRARFFTPAELESLIAACGFEVVEARRLTPDFGDPWIVARAAPREPRAKG